MNYGTLSPSGCAAEITNEILTITSPDPLVRDQVERLLRQKVRLILEECARVSEDYVANNDLDEKLTGMEVGDGIAETLRQMADERMGGDRLLQGLGICP